MPGEIKISSSYDGFHVIYVYTKNQKHLIKEALCLNMF